MKRKKVISLTLVAALCMSCLQQTSVAARSKVSLPKKVTVTKGKKVSVKLKNFKKLSKKQIKKVKWKSSNEAVAVVASSGKYKQKATITGKKAGSAKISVNFSGKKYVCKVIVKNKLKKESSTPKVTSAGAISLYAPVRPVVMPTATIKPIASTNPVASIKPSLFPATTDSSIDDPTTEPTVEPVKTEEPNRTKVPIKTAEPTVEPVKTAEPTATSVVTVEPKFTPEVIVTPTISLMPTEIPVSTPKITIGPVKSEEPDYTAEPVDTVKPTEIPKVTLNPAINLTKCPSSVISEVNALDNESKADIEKLCASPFYISNYSLGEGTYVKDVVVAKAYIFIGHHDGDSIANSYVFVTKLDEEDYKQYGKTNDDDELQISSQDADANSLHDILTDSIKAEGSGVEFIKYIDFTDEITVKTAFRMFDGVGRATSNGCIIKGLGNVSLANAEMSMMFQSAYIDHLNLSELNFDNEYAGSATRMFRGAKFNHIDGTFDTSNFVDMDYMFNYFDMDIDSDDSILRFISNMDVSRCDDFVGMFDHAFANSKHVELDLSKWVIKQNASYLTLQNLFNSCGENAENFKVTLPETPLRMQDGFSTGTGNRYQSLCLAFMFHGAGENVLKEHITDANGNLQWCVDAGHFFDNCSSYTSNEKFTYYYMITTTNMTDLSSPSFRASKSSAKFLRTAFGDQAYSLIEQND